jgi:hypothetical protein
LGKPGSGRERARAKVSLPINMPASVLFYKFCNKLSILQTENSLLALCGEGIFPRLADELKIFSRLCPIYYIISTPYYIPQKLKTDIRAKNGKK